MVEKASQAEVAFGDEMWIGRPTAPGATTYTWTQIFGLESLPFPEKVPDDIDVTHMQSPGRSRETIPGMMPVADTSVEKQYWPADPGDILLDELATLTETGTPESVLVEFNIDGGAGTSLRRTYRARVDGYTPQPQVTEKRMATLSLKVFDRQPSNPRPLTP